jgi:hypothetical protein
MILKYFMRNRQAADTYEGIVRWRLREETIHQVTEETQDALGWLVARGFLREERIALGPSLFRLNPEKHAEAQAFLEAEAARLEGE